MSETRCATGVFCLYTQLSNVFWQQLQFLCRSLPLFDLLLKDVTEQVELHFKYLSRNKLLNTDDIWWKLTEIQFYTEYNIFQNNSFTAIPSGFLAGISN